MPTDTIVRSEYRDHIIEIAPSEEAAGRWQDDWAVFFEREPFASTATGTAATPATKR